MTRVIGSRSRVLCETAKVTSRTARPMAMTTSTMLRSRAAASIRRSKFRRANRRLPGSMTDLPMQDQQAQPRKQQQHQHGLPKYDVIQLPKQLEAHPGTKGHRG